MKHNMMLNTHSMNTVFAFRSLTGGGTHANTLTDPARLQSNKTHKQNTYTVCHTAAVTIFLLLTANTVLIEAAAPNHSK